MQPIKLEKTFSTPAVIFTPENKTLLMEGRLIPENAEAIFTPILNWMDEYFNSGENTLNLVFRLYYYNTSSSKRIVLMLKKLDELFAAGKKINVRWEYEEGDDDCMHDGNDYSKLIRIPMEIVEIPET